MVRGSWGVILAMVGLAAACAEGSGPSRDSGVRLDGGPSLDTGMVEVDAGPVEPDAGPPEPDSGVNLTDGDTCDPCVEGDDCMSGLYCAGLTSGGSACLPACNIDLPDCPARFDCVRTFNETTLPEPICAPVGERCCVDADGDLHGSGVGCLGQDCDESDTATNSSATETCDGSDDDCDGMIDEGDPNALCPRGPHVAVSECAGGLCANTTCEPGFGDCDADPSNGCEQQTNTDLHCGGCFVGCEPANATGDCSTGTCDVAVCDDGFGDCDGDAANGCETALNTLSDCGRCGGTCSPPFGIGDCSTGTCEVGSCNPRYADCDGNVINGCETSTTNNADCGGCGVLCAPTNAVGECSTGTCRVVSCTRSDFDDCDGLASNGCETSLRTNTDCNACGLPCSIAGGSASCASGSCELTGCSMGLGDCDSVAGCEQMLNTNTHCGDCNTPCAPPNGTGSCSSGGCVITACNPGWDDCDGMVSNGCETALNTLSNCGSCGSTCALANASETCATGQCRIESCDSGFAQCDASHANGCETSTRTNSNCGACGVSCSEPNSTTSCSTGVCTWTGCNTGFSTCDGSTTNGCELDHATPVAACGGGSDAGTEQGDRSCGVICGSNTGWDLFATFTGQTDRWFQARLDEGSNCDTNMEHRIRLEVPDGVDYDLRVYRGSTCGTAIGSSTNRSNGTDESVTISQNDNYTSNDSFDYFVHVVWVGGRSCTEYTIRFDGHDC